MQASETKLQQIVEGSKQYIMPLFQRAYSWEKREWEVLWEDIIELSKKDEPRRPHFMGAIVTMPTETTPESITKFLLIDGQQRLTTIFILLSALRDNALNAEDKELGDRINDTILVNRYAKEDRLKLLPTQLDRQSFEKVINNKSEHSVDKNKICECYNFFVKKIRSSGLEFHKIHQLICSSISLISVVLNSDEDPYLVFESLNAKGRSLTQADLIRNYLFMQIDKDQQDDIHKQYWQPMETRLEDSLTKFIWHYLIKDGINIKENEIYFEFKERISKKEPVEYLKELSSFSEHYAKLLDPKKESNLDVSTCLDRLNKFELLTIYPFLINCYDNWYNKKIKEDELISILKIVENFIIRRFVCNIRTNGLNKIFASLYSQVSKGASLSADSFVNRLKLHLQNHEYPNDDEFKQGLLREDLYKPKQKNNQVKLILESLEEYSEHKEKVSFDGLSIEHIMPQTLTEKWQQYLGEDWEKTHQSLVNFLGNLTLTGYNAELSNNDFCLKREQFQNSHLELNKYFHHQESWRQDDIKRRGECLADRALKVWSYFGDGSVENDDFGDNLSKKPKMLKILGEEVKVKSWRDVLETTMNKLLNLEPDAFKDIMENYPRFVGLDQTKFRETRQLKNGAFVNVNLSAKDIRSFCGKALDVAEIPNENNENWEVIY